eukprot:3225968-Alexandrium_andersonii.AAC.1
MAQGDSGGARGRQSEGQKCIMRSEPLEAFEARFKTASCAPSPRGAALRTHPKSAAGTRAGGAF